MFVINNLIVYHIDYVYDIDYRSSGRIYVCIYDKYYIVEHMYICVEDFISCE